MRTAPASPQLASGAALRHAGALSVTRSRAGSPGGASGIVGMAGWRALVLGAALATLSGCGTHTFVFRDDVRGLLAASEEQPFIFYGLSQRRQLDVAEICGGAGNVVKVTAAYDVVDTILSVLSANVYYPLRAKVYCVE